MNYSTEELILELKKLISDPEVSDVYDNFVEVSFITSTSINLALNAIECADMTIWRRNVKCSPRFYPKALSELVNKVEKMAADNALPIPRINTSEPIILRTNNAIATSMMGIILGLYDKFIKIISKKIASSYPIIFSVTKQSNGDRPATVSYEKLMDLLLVASSMKENHKPFLYSLLPLRNSLAHVASLKEDVQLFPIGDVVVQENNINFKLATPRIYPKGGKGLYDPKICLDTIFILVVFLTDVLKKDMRKLIQKYDFI